MSSTPIEQRDDAVAALYEEAAHWHLNTGEQTIHAKRLPGRWRTLKWVTGSVWLLFFFGPYLRWGDRQAILFDIPERQFHIFGATILPQDFWMLSLVLLFFAILLAVSTALAGRVFCGFFCFQTVWTDVFTWLEERLEGNPQQRRKLDAAPWSASKVRVKAVKHGLWLVISVLTGFSFTAFFTDAFGLWRALFTLEASSAAWFTIGLFTVGTYTMAGFLREQACFWLCPYARIQGVMIDETSLVPTYDIGRGEPRGRLKKGESEAQRTTGDCVDCKQCIAVCPTGIDIRDGQSEGCIMCALCLDACDAVMDKVGRPRGLIRWSSLEAIESGVHHKIYQRPRAWFYVGILATALAGIGIGLSTLDAVDLKVLHERQALFVLQSDGSIQNKYTLKILNKMNDPVSATISASGLDGLVLVGGDEAIPVEQGVLARDVFVRVPRSQLESESHKITFRVDATDAAGNHYASERASVFLGPRH